MVDPETEVKKNLQPFAFAEVTGKRQTGEEPTCAAHGVAPRVL
jgi:hypothetical protein